MPVQIRRWLRASGIESDVRRGPARSIDEKSDEVISAQDQKSLTPTTPHVDLNLFFLCRLYVTRIQQTLDKDPQNC